MRVRAVPAACERGVAQLFRQCGRSKFASCAPRSPPNRSQLDPRDLDHSYLGRDHFNEIFKETENQKFVVSLGDLGESKDCDGSGSLFAGTSKCFELSRSFLDGFDADFDVVGGNHDLEGIGAR